jgi:hypothetical protein
MVVSPALQRGEGGQQWHVSPVEAVQSDESVVKMTFMRLPCPPPKFHPTRLGMD